MADRQVIRIASYGTPIKEERAAGGVITPGHLVTINSSNAVVVHPTAGGNAQKAFADVDDMQGRTIDDNYASGDRVHIWFAQQGERVNAILKDGENVVIGDALMSAGDGTLAKLVPDEIDSTDATDIIQSAKIVGYATHALDLSGSSGVDPSARLIIRVA